MSETLTPATLWYGNALLYTGSWDNPGLLNLLIYNYAISAASMPDVDLGPPYFMMWDNDGDIRYGWYAQGIQTPGVNTAIVRDAYERRVSADYLCKFEDDD